MLLLIDAFSTLYAGYHALAGTLNTTPANAALFGFFQSLMGRLRACPHATYVFLCMDSGRGFRHDLVEDYKAQRNTYKSDKEEMEHAAVRDGISEALRELQGLQFAMPWYHVERPDTEGDDLIGKLCQTYPNVHKQIVSGDKDMLQLINPYTSVYRRDKNVEITHVTFQGHVHVKATRKKEKVQLFFNTPDEWFLFRVLTGDPSDNIKGVPGIGDVGGHAIVRTLYTKFNGKVKALLDNPEKVLCIAGVANWQKISSVLKVSGEQIINRNISLMSLVEAADRIEDINPYVFTGNWKQGKSHFTTWLMQKEFRSILNDMPLFDDMGNKQGSA